MAVEQLDRLDGAVLNRTTICTATSDATGYNSTYIKPAIHYSGTKRRSSTMGSVWRDQLRWANSMSVPI